MERAEKYYWDEVYSSDINTMWGGLDPDSKIQEIILEYLKKNPEKKIRVIDIGCGNGRNSRIFDDQTEGRIEYVGLDYSSVAIDYCKKSFPNRVFVKEDILEGIKNPEGPFDLIIDFGCFHSIKPDERKKYAENILKISHNNTYFIMRAWYGGEEPPKSNPDLKPYLVFNIWNVNLYQIEELFGHFFNAQLEYLDKEPPYDFNYGIAYFILKAYT